MTNNRGTRLVNIPIRFRTGASRINWQIQENGTKLLVGSCQSGVALEHIDLGDGWDLVRRYLNVKTEDEQSILEFLVAHGWFKAPEGSTTTSVKSIRGSLEMVVESFSVQEFATIQDYVRRMLIAGNPTQPTPWHGGSIQRYEIAFADARSGSQAHVVVAGVFPSILATVQFKLAQGAKFRTCARKDCRLPFEVTSRHKRRFCTQYCAHITSLRQRRKVEGKRR